MSFLKQLNERKEDLRDTAQAILDVSASEKRGLTDDERKQSDSVSAELDVVLADIKRAEKVESFKQKIATDRHTNNPESDIKPKGDSVDLFDFNIPVKHRPRNAQRAFVGANADKEAFIAGQFGRAILGHADAKEWLQGRGYEVKAAMSTTDNSKGGFLIPDVLEATIVRLVQEYGVFRRNVGRVWPLQNGNISVPKRSGGFTFHWIGESTAIPDSEPTLDLVSLLAKKGAMLGRIPSELFEDSAVDLGEFLATEMAYAKAYAEDNAGFNGDGTSAFGSIVGLKNALAAGSKATAPASDGQTTLGGLKIGVFQEAMGKLKQYPGIMPKWYMSNATWENSAKRLAMAAGGNTVSDFTNGIQRSFQGYPVEISQVLPGTAPATAITSTIVAYFGDLAMSVAMGDARNLQVVADASRYFDQDQIAIRGTCRMDINVHERGTSSESGAMIALVTAGS